MTKSPPRVRKAELTAPDLAVQPDVYLAESQMRLQDVRQVADRASEMLVKVRQNMLRPHPRKHAPKFSTAQVAAACRITKDRANYLASVRSEALGLPTGTSKGQGSSREFTLAETMVWIDKIGPFPKRPEGVKGKKIAIGNFKGGVSKTTTAMTLAQGLTLYGRKVLIIDLDPQASLTTLTGMLADSEVSDTDTCLPLIYGEETSLEYAVQKTYWENLDLIPASAALFGAEFYLPFKQSKDPSFRFWEVLNKGLEPLLDIYDVVVIDTPPALSYMTINAFMAADGLIVPTPPSALDYASSTQFWNLFSDLADSMTKLRPDLEKTFSFVHVLLAKVDSQQASTHVVREWIKMTYGKLVLPMEIPTTIVTQAASADFGTVYDISKYEGSQKTYQRAREAYDSLCGTIDHQLIALWSKEKEST